MADSFMQQLIASLARRTPVLDDTVSYGTGSPGTKGGPHQPAVPFLLFEDRADFERTLDEALRAHVPTGSERLNSEQLRTMALTAGEAIAATAAPEYAHYIQAREQARNVRGSEVPLADKSPAEQRGASLGAVMTVLAPILFGTAAVIFLLGGYILKVVNPHVGFAGTMLTTGWVFGAVTAICVLLAMVGLLLTASRDASQEDLAKEDLARFAEVAVARDAWRQALRRRGIDPFLRDVRQSVSRGLDHDQAP
jgi:hypothetical protein